MIMRSSSIYYYITSRGENPVRDFIESLSYKQRAKIRRAFLAIKEYGLQALPAQIKKLKGFPLWELRIIGRDNIRVFYVPVEGKVLMLHGFIKKAQKTPLQEIKIALRRYKLWIISQITLDK